MDNKGKIESSIGKVSHSRSFNRVLTVDDPTVSPAQNFETHTNIQYESVDEETLNKLNEARKERVLYGKRASEPAKNRLDILLGIARLAEDITVDGVTFSIRSLKAYETTAVMEAVMELENKALQAFEMRDQTMVRSLYAIDGHNIYDVIGSDKFEDKLAFIRELDTSLLNHLYDRYTLIIKKSNERFAEDLGKDEKEIIENVKK